MPPNPACQIAAAALLTQAKYIFGRNFVKNASLFSKPGDGTMVRAATRSVQAARKEWYVNRKCRVGQRERVIVKAQATLTRGRAVSILLSSPGTPVL
jgi:hypothetical protein